MESHLRQAFCWHSQQSFGHLAQRVTPIRTFDDLIVSPSLAEQLQEVLTVCRYRSQVMASGFARKVGKSQCGTRVLFYGDSGTGKTLAAEVLAQALERDLIKVDLSTVVNKYVGETEKNLSTVFDRAARDSGVLFFDEADALFGKRSETKDAHDRHANIEVSYLLQRMEQHPGLVILSTNHRSHLDSAFNRRFSLILRFKRPEVDERERLWRHVWPAEIRLSEDVDLMNLATKTLTGANIHNVAIMSACLAASQDCDILSMGHIQTAIQREMDKTGQIT